MKYKDLVKKVKELEQRLNEVKPEEPKHKFKVGDRVQFKTWEEMEKEFGCNEFGDIKVYWRFSSEMKFLCGTYATIESINNSGDCDLKDFTANGEANKWFYCLDMLKPAVNEPKVNKSKWTFTEDEKVILRNVDEKYKWIARDDDGDISISIDIPQKQHHFWKYKETVNNNNFQYLQIFNHLFKTIKWEDDNACEFRKYI